MCIYFHFNSFLILFVIANLGIGVKINKLSVPEVISHGNPVILDCDFSVDGREQDLVVKWFFNKTLVYQWIPARKEKPRGLGVLKERLNLGYKASLDANSIHRALHILKASPDLSGDYTCSVSTLESEDIRTKSMLVLVSEQNFVLRKSRTDEGLMRVQCLVDGIFPKPVMSLHSQGREITDAQVTAHQRERDKLYVITATATLPALDRPEEFSCKLHIPQANYTTRRETVFYPGNGSRITTNSLLISISIIVSWIYCTSFSIIGSC